MSEPADALAIKADERSVSIEITNYTTTSCLLDPRVFLESGHCHSPPQPTIRTQKTEVCNFSNNGDPSGAVGVLTYDILKMGEKEAEQKIALMFSVPFNWDANVVAVGLYERDRVCDEALYKEMYKDKFKQNIDNSLETECWKADGSCVLFVNAQLRVMCAMSTMRRAIMKVELWDF